MDNRIDCRLGHELGLDGIYSDVPAFQIVSDAAQRLASFTARIVALKYGPHAVRVRSHPDWRVLDRSKTEFSRRLDAIGSDAFAAAALDAEILCLEQTVLGPLSAIFESRSS